MHDLIGEMLVKRLGNPVLRELTDSAFIDYKEGLAFTTDSFVVSPLFFPGGDIGKLAVCGTVNDLVMMGAVPEFLSLALIIEEGLDKRVLCRVIDSISATATKCGVKIATGDLKVVEKGAADKLFINTSGIGRVVGNRKLSARSINDGDKIILTGDIGRHGLAVLTKRKDLGLGFSIRSDCAALNHLIVPIIKKARGIKFMRDPTRGGVATTLNEIAVSSGIGIVIEEESIPVLSKVKAAGELLGIEPLYVACEGCAIIVVKTENAGQVLRMLKKNRQGFFASIVGEFSRKARGRVVLNTSYGTRRIIDMLAGEALPRIC